LERFRNRGPAASRPQRHLLELSESPFGQGLRSLSSAARIVGITPPMMETSRTAKRAFLVACRVGVQARFDVAAIAEDLARQPSGVGALRVLFDWSQLKSWPFAAPSLAATRKWKDTAPPVVRAALVHDRKWNRHAAVLSALLRVGGAEARSFPLSGADKAIAWLEEPTPI